MFQQKYDEIVLCLKQNILNLKAANFFFMFFSETNVQYCLQHYIAFIKNLYF